MAALIDTSIWVAVYRTATPEALRLEAAAALNQADAHSAPPVPATVCGALVGADLDRLRRHLQTLPVLPLPEDVWEQAMEWMARAGNDGLRLPLAAALIALTARHHGATLVACDSVYAPLVSRWGLKLRLLA